MKDQTICLIVFFWIWMGRLFWAMTFEATRDSILWSGYAIFLCWFFERDNK